MKAQLNVTAKTIEAEIVKFDFANANSEFLVKINGKVQIASSVQWLEELEAEEASVCDVIDFAEANFTPGTMVEVEEGSLELVGLAWILCDCNSSITNLKASDKTITCPDCGQVWNRK